MPHQRPDSLIDDSRVTLLIYPRILFFLIYKAQAHPDPVAAFLKPLPKRRPNNCHVRLDNQEPHVLDFSPLVFSKTVSTDILYL
jgi:hypothetical protein